jgi:hypothetical protein
MCVCGGIVATKLELERTHLFAVIDDWEVLKHASVCHWKEFFLHCWARATTYWSEAQATSANRDFLAMAESYVSANATWVTDRITILTTSAASTCQGQRHDVQD